MPFRNIYSDKKVLVTGHTGFKGSWLISWLHLLNAKIYGLALDPPSKPSHYEVCHLSELLENDFRGDIRDPKLVKQYIAEIEPDFIFHLAAQSLVKESHESPEETFSVNVIGTLNLLEGLRLLKNKFVAVLITSDKCYENLEWPWGYRETDRLGGLDPYSASKASTEILIRAYIKSFFQSVDGRIGIARAGNVIGGGDWAKDRIVPDCMSAWAKGDIVELRNPYSTRPWQHVLEPLSGYLCLGEALSDNPSLHGEPFNFGPPARQNATVLELVEEMKCHWEDVRWKEFVHSSSDRVYEAGLLKLNCDKALQYLGWEAVFNFQQTVEVTTKWYKAYYEGNCNVDLTTSQIHQYRKLAQDVGLPWVK
jgi:CDP-glucose 4,6-dehydratase